MNQGPISFDPIMAKIECFLDDLSAREYFEHNQPKFKPMHDPTLPFDMQPDGRIS